MQLILVNENFGMASFERAYAMKGFDRYRTHRWQMVPKSGVRYIIVRDAVGLTLSFTNAHRLRMTEINRTALPAGHLRLESSDRFIKLDGLNRGSARVYLKNAVGSTVKRLEVGVKRRKRVKVSFNFVRDSAGNTTARNTANAAAWVRAMDRVFDGQANINVSLGTSRVVNVASDLGATVTWSAGAASEWNTVTALGDSTADMNFFLVWEYEQDTTPGDGADAGTLGGNCIYEDAAGSQDGETMAHELGHFLGCPDHYIDRRKRELMFGTTDTRGVHLPKADVNIVNP